MLSTVEMLGRFATVIATFGSSVAWISASFDTHLKSPEVIKGIADLGWMWFNPTAMINVIQFSAFGTACLLDKRPQPLFPEWMSWFSYAMAATLLSALLTPFFTQRPFAWHGLLCYYVGLGGYFTWIVVACYFVLKVIGRLELEAQVSGAESH